MQRQLPSFFLCLVIASIARAARADEAPSPARVLFQEASTAADAKDWSTCIAKADAAWAKFQHAQIRGLKGMCEARLKRYREGAQDMHDYVTSGSGQVDATIAAAYADAKQEVAEIAVRSTPDEGDVSVDGVHAGKSPTTVFVDPGTHTIEAKSGASVGTDRRDYSAGTHVDVAIALKGKGPDGSGGASASSRSRVPAIVGFGLAGAAVLVGAITTGLSFKASSDANAAASTLGKTCSSMNPTNACQAGFDDQKRANTMGNVAGSSFITAGVLVAVSIPLFVWVSNGPKTTASLTVAPIISRDTHGLVFGARF